MKELQKAYAHKSQKIRVINSLNQSKKDSMIHLADSVMEISVPSILSAFWTFSMMGLLTWEETRRQMWPRENGIFSLNVHVSIYINLIVWPWAQWGTNCSWVCIFHPAEGTCTAAHHSSENTGNIYNSSCGVKYWKNDIICEFYRTCICGSRPLGGSQSRWCFKHVCFFRN